MRGNDYVRGRSQIQNIKAVIEDILGHGNEKCLLPGQPEANWGTLSKKYDGLLFKPAEIEELNHILGEVGESHWKPADFKSIQI
jgi:hypothetical protein